MSSFKYTDERFADIQMLRYRLNGFDSLTLRQKKLVYYLSQAALCGRDITFDQFGKYNLRIRKMLEVVYTGFKGDRDSRDFKSLTVYLKRVWFSSGIYHHYGCEKFVPEFSEQFLRDALCDVDTTELPLCVGQTLDEFCREVFPVIFNPDILPKRVNQADGEDLVRTSACNYYDGVTQKEVEDFYAGLKDIADEEPPSYGLNTHVTKINGVVKEIVWKEDGMYGKAIKNIIYWLDKAAGVAENDRQCRVIETLIRFYRTGDLHDFNKYCIEWVGENEGHVDFINGFIEVYGDPLGLKGSWEGLVEYRDVEGSRRTRTISDNAQWFEDHSPVDPRFRKPHVKGVTANVICASMLGGDEYPATAIGINLPNADWIRARYGSKSITISNITAAYNEASRGSGFKEEFIIDRETMELIDKYGGYCDGLHTDLHECLGHGSGRLLDGVDPDSLKAYGSTIEEARADLFALYYMADEKMLELGLLPDKEAYKSQYYTYIMNGMMTQLVRIKPGNKIEEAHMRNRALIARWCYEKGCGEGVVELVSRNDKTFVRINSYEKLRSLFATLLAEIQRIKSEGDYDAACELVEKYAVDIDPVLHDEIIRRYERLNLAPYKGFINPVLKPVLDDNGEITDIDVNYTETYTAQMLRYGREFGL